MTTYGADLDVEALLRLRGLAASLRGGRKPLRSPLPGAVLHRRRGRGLELYDIRAWSEADDMRHLDPNVTARTGAPHVRTFRDERERSVLLVVDFRPAMMFGTRRALRSVAAAEAIAVLAWRVIEEGGRLSLAAATADGVWPLGQARGARAMVSLIGELAGAHRDALASAEAHDPPLAAILKKVEGMAVSGSIFVATGLDVPGDSFDEVAERLARKRDLSVALIADRFEIDPPQGGYPFRTNAGDVGWLRVTEGPAPDARLARLRRLGVNFMQIDAALDPKAMARTLERLDG
jgi:uncharacterized protein (DUF58 family)